MQQCILNMSTMLFSDLLHTIFFKNKGRVSDVNIFTCKSVQIARTMNGKIGPVDLSKNEND